MKCFGQSKRGRLQKQEETWQLVLACRDSHGTYQTVQIGQLSETDVICEMGVIRPSCITG